MMTAIAHLPVRDHCLAPSRGVDGAVRGGRYARLLPDLPALDVDEDLLHALGGVGGPVDGSQDPGSDDARTVAAGWPFFGQFVAHDLTADRSPLAARTDARTLRNLRSPRIDLELLYGGGPVGSPFLYDRDDPAKLLVGVNDAGRAADVPRNQQDVAIIGDPRNDVHLFVSQLHVAMLRLHNGLVDRLRADGEPEPGLFAQAQLAARWHYQWVVLHDFLPRVIGDELFAELLAGGSRWYRRGPADEAEPFIPLEFADAAYRYGHAQIRHRYRLNADCEPLPLLPDLMGLGRAVPDRYVLDWSGLFDLPGRPAAQRAKRIDGRLVGSLIALPNAVVGEVDVPAYRSLAVRDLQRGQAVGLPSGEAVARLLGLAALAPDDVGLGALGWHGETPLWYYILKEAETLAGGERLGPVGGRIVGEVLLGVVDADPGSHRSVDPDWRPTLPAVRPGNFTLADLLDFTDRQAEASSRK